MSVEMAVYGTIALLIFSLVLGVYWYGKGIREQYVKQYPAPGKMIDVGGYHLHINCQGFDEHTNTPTVILEASDFSLGWDFVQPEVARFAKVCSYDRAGLGWSERSPNSRTADNIVKELHVLLERAEVKPPYVLVGHSKGGMFMRLFAHIYPDEVAGMVLVDAAHEEQELRFPEKITQINQQSRKQTAWIMNLVCRLRLIWLLALIVKKKPESLIQTIPEKVREMSLAFVLTDTFLETVAEETNALTNDFAAIRDAGITSLGDIPLLVLTAADQFKSLEKHVPAEDIEKLIRIVDELQLELTLLSPQGKQIKVKESSHFIHVDQPQFVINAIREVIDAIPR